MEIKKKLKIFSLKFGILSKMVLLFMLVLSLQVIFSPSCLAVEFPFEYCAIKDMTSEHLKAGLDVIHTNISNNSKFNTSNQFFTWLENNPTQYDNLLTSLKQSMPSEFLNADLSNLVIINLNNYLYFLLSGNTDNNNNNLPFIKIESVSYSDSLCLFGYCTQNNSSYASGFKYLSVNYSSNSFNSPRVYTSYTQRIDTTSSSPILDVSTNTFYMPSILAYSNINCCVSFKSTPSSFAWYSLNNDCYFEPVNPEPSFRPFNGVIETYIRNSGDTASVCISECLSNDYNQYFNFIPNYLHNNEDIKNVYLGVYLEEINIQEVLNLTPYNYLISSKSNNITKLYNFSTNNLTDYKFYFNELISYMKSDYIYRLQFDFLIDRGNNDIYSDFCTSCFFSKTTFSSEEVIIKNIFKLISGSYSGDNGSIFISGDDSSNKELNNINNSLIDVNNGITNISNTLTESAENTINDTIITSGDIESSLGFDFMANPYSNFWFEMTQGLSNCLTSSVRQLPVNWLGYQGYFNLDGLINYPTPLKNILTTVSTVAIVWLLVKWWKIIIDKLTSGGIDEVLAMNEEERYCRLILGGEYMLEAIFNFIIQLFFWLIGLIGSIVIYPIQLILVSIIPRTRRFY